MSMDQLQREASAGLDLPVPMWRYDGATLRIVDVNDAAVCCYGWSRDEFLTKTILDLRPEEDVAPLRASLSGHPRDQFVDDGVWRHLTRSGDVRHVRVTSQPCGEGRERIVAAVDVTAAVEKDRALEGMVQALVKVTELRDPYTAGHQNRVAHLATAIGRVMGLDDHRLRGLELAAGVHDIGKIAVPAEILVKPSRLTSYERESVRHHVVAGWTILDPIEFPWPIATIVRAHHERLDGSGYPDGLHGDDIPLESRIIAVADVVESMASHRPYRAAPGLDEAVHELRRHRDILFDGDVLDAFEWILTEPPDGLEWLRLERRPRWVDALGIEDGDGDG